MEKEKDDKKIPKKEEVTLDQIVQECKDKPGYVIFVGMLSPKRDKFGFNLIDWKYRRYQFAGADAVTAAKVFEEMVQKDIQGDDNG